MKIKDLFILILLPVHVVSPVIPISKENPWMSFSSIINQDSLPKKAIPVLSYNSIKKNIVKGSLNTIPEIAFKEHLIAIRNHGYQTILPDQIYRSVTKSEVLPPKPIMLSFDDTYAEDYEIAFPILNILGFKAVFFVNTVVIDKPGYMTASQIKELADSGHVIGGHTWNHPYIQRPKERDMVWQIDKPKQEIEKITGKPVEHFAYPYDVWNDAGIAKLKKHGVKTAFQLSGKQSEKNPLHTIRRLAVPGTWSASELLAHIDSTFNTK
jgi:peptidoglycan/xylan/chitin deacetylase (PgdA/CDA1 family)